MDPLLNINEAAELLGLSAWTVRKLVASHRLRAVRINRRVLIQPEEIRRIIEEGRDHAESSLPVAEYRAQRTEAALSSQ